jgi:penicillin-binding protein 1C
MQPIKRLYRIAFILVLFLSIITGLLFWSLFSDLPKPEELTDRLQSPSIRILDSQDRLLYEALPVLGGRHQVIPLESMPPYLTQATIATEDNRFYQHPGVDWTGILRAFWINLQGGETLAGGSTITQQVARTLLLSEEERFQPTLRRKLRESYLAWRLTRTYTKDEILAFYLNQSYYGSLAYGVEAAAQTYFGKSVQELDLAECALLAGLPQAPALYSPLVDPDAAKQRQAVVLTLMEEAGFIDADQRRLAAREQLIYADVPYPMEAPHFVLMVLAQLDGILLVGSPERAQGITVHTTLNLDWQRQAEVFIQRQLGKLAGSQSGLGHNVNNAALVALDPQTGAILAMVGSPDYHNDQVAGAINMVLSPRQPGSALKPLVYAAALSHDRSDPWTAATALLDVRTSFVTHEGDAYTPANYDLIEHGPVSLRVALASSLNIPAVITLDHIGLDSFFQFVYPFGLDKFGDPNEYDLSLALGGGAVSLLDLTTAYGTFANGGLSLSSYAIQHITNPNSDTVYAHNAPHPLRLIDARLAWLISDILSDEEARQVGFGSNSILQTGYTTAVKTGTTSNFHDNWTIGYTPDLVVGVWAGNASYQPMRDVSGVTGAAPIWAAFIRSVLDGQPDQPFPQPAGLVQVEVCAISGLLPSQACPYTRLEWFIDGTQPTALDTVYQSVQLDLRTGRLASADTPPEMIETRLALDLPPQAQAWARQNGVLLLSDLLAAEPGSVTGSEQPPPSSSSLVILNPPDRSLFRLDSSLPAESQRLPIEISGPPALQSVSLWVDNILVSSLTAAPYRFWWTLEPGAHTLRAEALLQSGETIASPTLSFTVNEK